MRFDDVQFIDLVRNFVQGIDDDMIVRALRDGTKDVARTQHFFQRYAPQQGVVVEYDGEGNFTGQTAGEGNDPRVFFIAHPNWDFGRIKQFVNLETRARIDIDTGQPDIHLESNPNRTTIVCEYFADRNIFGGIKAAADVALVPTDDTEEIEDVIFRQYKNLFRAAAMKELPEFTVKHLAGPRNWQREYQMLSDAALERYFPNRLPLPPTRSCIRPPGGGFNDANSWRTGGGVYGIGRRRG